MGYDDAKQYGGNVGTTWVANDPNLKAPRPIRQSPDALKALASASANYSAAAAKFLDARDDLNDARAEWERCRDQLAKLAEQEGI